MFEKYIARLCAEIEYAQETANQMGGLVEHSVDSIYLGGGTPTLLDVSQLERVFVAMQQNFKVLPRAEITVECAPGTVSDGMLGSLVRYGVNRVSLGVQSFVDRETRSVGRLHSRATVLSDIARLRSAGVSNINLDLIAGLPHQTQTSWGQSLDELIATGVPHASVYMLEVDEDSRLGREVMAGGQKYHAHFVPDEDLTADLYEIACERLNAAGIKPYEISNFAGAGFESKHNLKYWTRQPYLGFGVDAHSMLRASPASGRALEQEQDWEGHGIQACPTQRNPTCGTAVTGALANAIRFCNPDNLESYLSASQIQQVVVSWEAALQETCFLGLRLTNGLDLEKIAAQFGEAGIAELSPAIAECQGMGLMEQERQSVRLTPKGRLLSNEVFQKFIGT
jgi:oxygen-independent coproporphyrinogen III oxidase